MAYNGYTEARKRANIKYLAEKTDDIRLRMPKGTKEKWRSAAEKSGESMTKFVARAVEEKIRSLSEENQNEIRTENPSDAPMRLF